MNIILFVFIFLYTANWVRAKLIIQGLGKPKKVFTSFKNKKFLDKVNKKIGLPFVIKVQNSPWIFGYSPSVPLKPIFVVSKGAITHLKENELEWLVLHEMGHCVMWHIVKETLLHLGLLILGIAVVYYLNLSFLLAAFLGVFFGIVWYQIERIFEMQADTFSLQRIDDPKGMIGANQKMKARGRSVFYKKPLLTFLFTPHLGYDQRIEMATKKLKLSV